MYMLLFFSTFTVFLDSISALSLPKNFPQCGPNEMATDCYNDCQLTCQNRLTGYKADCENVCSQTGCVCLPNFFRDDNGICVREGQCSPPRCNDNEMYKPCGTSCLDTCEERGNTCRDCALRCVEGCFCREGTFRAENGTCVEEEECAARTCSDPNEYFDECPEICLGDEDQSCSAVWIGGANCTETLSCCDPKCRCKEGYYRNTEGFCISAEECWYDFENYIAEGLFSLQSKKEDK